MRKKKLRLKNGLVLVSPREKENYSKNLSILNISSYSDFEILKYSERKPL